MLIFRSKFLLDNYQGIFDFEKRFNATPSLTPALTWISTLKPETPTFYIGNSVVVSIDAQGQKL